MDAPPVQPTQARLIGPGRAGRSLAGALERRGWHIQQSLGRHDDLSQAAHGVEVVIVAVPDDAIGTVAAAVKPGDAALVHLSGAKTLDVLAPHRRRGSFHPLVSLPEPEIGRNRLLDRPTVAIAGDPITARMASDLGVRAITVDDEHRALYHATAAIAANHLTVLAAQVEALATQLNLPVEIYWELMATTLANITADGARPSLTGPAARGDHETVSAHLDALPAQERPLYQLMANRAYQLAQISTDGSLEEDEESGNHQ